jgi:hypothetical protein
LPHFIIVSIPHQAELLRECQLAEASDRCAAAAAYRSASSAALLLRSAPAPAPEVVLTSNPMFDGPAEPIPAPAPPPSQSQEQASLKRTVTALNDAALAHVRAALRLRNIGTLVSFVDVFPSFPKF